MNFVREDSKDEYGILKLQDKLLEIMVDIDKFCQKHDIDYCLMAGSALGARRHNGFIPWDDDIDIYMSENDYDKFRKCFNDQGNKEKYYLQEWGKTDKKGHHFISMAKVRMNHTLLDEKMYFNWKMHKGAFVDIFILHNSPNERSKQIKQYIWTETVVLKGLALRGYKAKSFKEKVMLLAAKLLPTNWIKYHGLKHTYKYQHAETNFCSGFVDTRSLSRALYPKEVMFPTKYADFENVRLKVPNDIDTYLRIQFGDDYMQLPPVEKRPINKHATNWQAEYPNEFDDLSDEKKLI